MRIKKFKMGGHSIKVIYAKTVRCDETGQEIFGKCNSLTNEISLATHIGGVKLSEDVINQTFFHEFVHLSLIILNEFELNSNEKFVDTFAHLIYNLHSQIIK